MDECMSLANQLSDATTARAVAFEANKAYEARERKLAPLRFAQSAYRYLGWHVLLFLLSWLALGRLCWRAEFMAPYVIFSMLAGIFGHVLLDPRVTRKGELSAYSVFNENNEELTGTLNASQFEGSMRSGGMNNGRQKEARVNLSQVEPEDTFAERSRQERRRRERELNKRANRKSGDRRADISGSDED